MTRTLICLIQNFAMASLLCVAGWWVWVAVSKGIVP
jgi:hypothetical protein